MKRLTTDNPQNDIETALNRFYVKDGWTWVRGSGPEPEYPDVSLNDYVRQIAKAFPGTLDIDSDASDDGLSEIMADWLFYGNDTAEGVVASFYAAAWAFAELRHRLALYEDTDLTPEEINRILDAYGRGMTLRSEVGERVEIVKDISTDRLRELARAEEEGRLVLLPCKIGDTAWFVSQVFNGKEIVATVGRRAIDGIGGNRLNPVWMVSKEPYELHFHPSEFGRTVFLTREDAEAALAQKGDNKR